MAGEGHFIAGGEDADFRRAPGVVRRQHEAGLGVIELARDRQHRVVGESAAVHHHRELVAGEALFGEYVERDIGAGHGGPLRLKERPS